MCLLLFAFSAIIDRKPVRFVILVVLASFFHVPALIFLPAYWIANIKAGRNYLALLAVVFVVTYALRGQVLNLLNDAYYASEVDPNTNVRFLANKVVVMLVIIVTAVLVRPPEPEDRVYSALLQLMGVSAVLQTFAGYSNVFERLADYYFQFSVLFIPMVFERIRPRRQYLSREALNLVYSFAPYVFGMFAIWRFLDTITNDVHFTPFRFFFE